MTDRASWLVTRSRGQLRVAYGAGRDMPQYAALHLRDSYLRLNYGPGAGWGTSVILLPVYWRAGVCYHGARVDAAWEQVGADLVLYLTGSVGRLDVALCVTLAPPEHEAAIATVQAECSGLPSLDARPGEAFKPVMLSSMHVGAGRWDAESARVDGRRVLIPRQGWLGRDPQRRASTFGLLGGTSLWKRNAPTVDVELDAPMEIAGWVRPSEDPNDDNVGLWAASDRTMTHWSYRIIVTPAGDTAPDGRPPGALRIQGHEPCGAAAPL